MSTLKLLLIAALLALSSGCGGCNEGQVTNLAGGTSAESATDVTVAQLKVVTKNETFYWFGCDKDFHYFAVKREFFRIPRSTKLPGIQDRIDNFLAREWVAGSVGEPVHVDDGGAIARGIK